jgi:hypothetical protein
MSEKASLGLTGSAPSTDPAHNAQAMVAEWSADFMRRYNPRAIYERALARSESF